jgi:glycosyltransferase involved in cell wall biosynthesis
VTGLVVYRALGGLDAIDEHSRMLVAALCETGEAVCYTPDGLAPLRGKRVGTTAWVLLQYNPFRFGRAGFATRLVADAAQLRRAGVPFAVMVHEAWIEIKDARSALIGGNQRIQLRALLRLADAALASTEALAASLRAEHLPVASNIRPEPITRAEARARLGLGDQLVVALLGRRHPSRALDHAARAVAALADTHELTVLNLGADAPSLPVAADIRSPGYLEPAELSRRLRAADLVLLPFVDGLSTRRTTLMAALAHGLPVLGTRGPRSDRVLIDNLALTPAGNPAAFARAAVALAEDPQLRRAAGEAGRALYAERFDWPVMARRVVSVLDRIAPARRAEAVA